MDSLEEIEAKKAKGEALIQEAKSAEETRVSLVTQWNQKCAAFAELVKQGADAKSTCQELEAILQKGRDGLALLDYDEATKWAYASMIDRAQRFLPIMEPLRDAFAARVTEYHKELLAFGKANGVPAAELARYER